MKKVFFNEYDVICMWVSINALHVVFKIKQCVNLFASCDCVIYIHLQVSQMVWWLKTPSILIFITKCKSKARSIVHKKKVWKFQNGIKISSWSWTQ
jgi:hypothetical protein